MAGIELWPLGPAMYPPQAGVSCADCMVLCFGVVWAFKKKLLCQAAKCWLAQLWVMVWMWTASHRLVGLNMWSLVGGAVFRYCGMWCLFIARISGGFWMLPSSLSDHFSLGCIYLLSVPPVLWTRDCLCLNSFFSSWFILSSPPKMHLLWT